MNVEKVFKQGGLKQAPRKPVQLSFVRAAIQKESLLNAFSSFLMADGKTAGSNVKIVIDGCAFELPIYAYLKTQAAAEELLLMTQLSNLPCNRALSLEVRLYRPNAKTDFALTHITISRPKQIVDMELVVS